MIIDQLIYGHWGSTSWEGAALGKPVICYFRSEWKSNYVENLGIEIWPFIEPNPQTIYSVIKDLLTNSMLMSKHSELSREFATKYLDVKKNAKEFIRHLNSI